MKAYLNIVLFQSINSTMKKKTWFEEFSSALNVIFTKEDFKKYYNILKKDIPLYRKYIKTGGKILEAGCGFGCGLIPLSLFGYKMTGIELDELDENV